MSERLARVVYPIVILLIVIGFYWKLVLTKQYDWIWGPDLATQVLPWFQVQARLWHAGQFPLWDQYLWLGQPILGQAQPGGAYPLNWILFLLPLDHGFIRMGFLQWYFVVIHYMAALFCFWLCRDLGRSRAASLIAGLVFAFACFIGTVDWPQMLNGAVWAPLVFLFLLRAVRGHKAITSAALSGFFLGVAWLSGHHQIPIYTTMAFGFTWLYFILRQWRAIRLAVIAFVFMVLTGALQTLPAYEYGNLAVRWVGADHPLAWNETVPYTIHQLYAMYPTSLLGIVFPGMGRNADPFIGVVGVALAVLGVAMGWKQRWVPLFGALALGGLVYSLGHNSVFHGVLYSLVPLAEKARTSSMADFIFGFGVAVLVAFGVDAFAGANKDSRWPRRAIGALLIFGGLAFAIFFVLVVARQNNFDDRIVMAPFIALLLAALLHAWRTGNLSRNAALVLLVMLLALELGNDSGHYLPHRTEKERAAWLDKIRGNTGIAAFLRSQPGNFRVDIPGEEVPANWGAWNGIDAWGGLLASVSTNLLDFEFQTWPTKMFYGVRYTLAPKPVNPTQQEVFSGSSGLKVYLNPDAFPRAWAVHQLVQVASPKSGNALIQEHLGDLRDKAYMSEMPPALANCAGPDKVAVERDEGSHVHVLAQMNCPGMLVLSDTYFPGWRASVDGRPTDIFEVNGAMRGVQVPAGVHVVDMVYRPRSVLVGAAMSLSALLGVCFLVFRSRKTPLPIDLTEESRNNT